MSLPSAALPVNPARIATITSAGLGVRVRAVLTAMASAGPDGLDPQLRRLYL